MMHIINVHNRYTEELKTVQYNGESTSSLNEQHGNTNI